MEKRRDIVLIIDDNSISRSVLESMIHSLGSDVVSFRKGKEALEYLKKGQGFYNVVCVISDYHMPECDGLDVLKRLRSFNNYRKTPFILFTSKDFSHVKEEFIKLECNAYINKNEPFTDCLLKVEEVLRVSLVSKGP